MNHRYITEIFVIFTCIFAKIPRILYNVERQTTKQLKKLTMKKLIFFTSLLFIFSISSCDNSLSPAEEKAFVQNLEKRVQARKPFLDEYSTIKKVVLSRTGEGAFEGYIDYERRHRGIQATLKIKSMEINVTLYVNGDFSVRKR